VLLLLKYWQLVAVVAVVATTLEAVVVVVSYIIQILE
jgi:hypothetical protein